MQKHTHAFLFFLGGLFLMLIGPSLIPFSSAATTAATATATTLKNLTQNIDTNQNILTAVAAAKASPSDTELAATMKIVANMLRDISELANTDYNIAKAKAAVANLQQALEKIINNITITRDRDDNTRNVRDYYRLSELNEALKQALQVTTKAKLNNVLTQAANEVNINNSLVKATNNQSNGCKTDNDCTARPWGVCFKIPLGTNWVCGYPSANQTTTVKSAPVDTHASAAASNTFATLNLTNLSYALAKANVPSTLPTAAKDSPSIYNYFIRFFQVAFQNLNQNLANVANYIATYDQRVQALKINNIKLEAKLNVVIEALQNIAPEATQSLQLKLNAIDDATIWDNYNDTANDTQPTAFMQENEEHGSATWSQVKRN